MFYFKIHFLLLLVCLFCCLDRVYHVPVCTFKELLSRYLSPTQNVCGYLSTIRSNVRLRRQSVRPFSPSSTSRPHGTHGNIIIRGGPSLRRRPGYVPCPGDRDMEGDGGWGPPVKEKKTDISQKTLIYCTNTLMSDLEVCWKTFEIH